MLIETGNLTPEMLAGQVAVVTGAGGGIGYETARALLWLGASVIIAEINQKSGKAAALQLGKEFDPAKVTFIHTDLGSQRSITSMVRQVLRRFGKVDILINNATVTPLGAVQDVNIKQWDWSYRVNLRGPVLLTQAFLPGMLERNYGVLMSISSYSPGFYGCLRDIQESANRAGQYIGWGTARDGRDCLHHRSRICTYRNGSHGHRNRGSLIWQRSSRVLCHGKTADTHG
jgi:hypothetical protein